MTKALLLPLLAAHLAFPTISPAASPTPDSTSPVELVDPARVDALPATLEILFSEPATVVLEPNGDVVVEFDPICEIVWSQRLNGPECTFPARYVRYSYDEDRTEGYGVLFGSADDGSVWTIDLAQIDWAGGSQLLEGNLAPLIALEIGGSERAGTTSFSWAGLSF